MIPREKIEAILQETDIVKVIGDQIPLQKKGRVYFGVCPFHNDKNPSMAVNREKRIYKCFSCGAGGNAIHFLENYSHISFLEALKLIASTTSVDLEKDFAHLKRPVEKFNPQQKLLFQLNESALRYFKVTLASKLGKSALEYLRQRGIGPEEREMWELGYSNSQTALYQFLLNQGYTIAQIKASSLITMHGETIKNYFNNRLIFPIRDLEGNLIGFSGRSVKSQDSVKYLNIRETLVFKKSELLFNVHHAIKVINRTRTIIITEGFMDVLSLARIGFIQSVATMGTNFSNSHLKLLKKLNATVILFFDGDKAGVDASWKVVFKLMSHNLKVKVVDNPTKNDPDELIQTGKSNFVRELVEKALNPWDYALKKLPLIYDLKDSEGLKSFLVQIFNLLRIDNDPIIVNQMLKKLAALTQVDQAALEESYNHKRRTPPVSLAPLAPNSPSLTRKMLIEPYLEILATLAWDPNQVEIVESKLELIYQTIDARDINFILVVKKLIESYRNQAYHPGNWEELCQIFQAMEFEFDSPQWQLTPEWFSKLPKTKSLAPIFLILEERYWRKKEAYYREKLTHTQDPTIRNNYFLQHQEIHRKLVNLKKQRTG